MDEISSFFGRSGLLPHGICLSWRPGVLWTLVAADALIALAYLSIPLAIWQVARRRGHDSLLSGRMSWLFGAFILACGTTHLLDVWTLWQPDYGLLAVSKALTAVVSLLTALVLWRLLPQLVALPSVRTLQSAVSTLEAEVRQRKTAEQHLADLEVSLAVTLASIDAGFIAADRHGRVTRMNAVAERVTGWTEAEARGRSTWEVFMREDRPLERARRNPVDVMLEHGITADTRHHVVAISRSGERSALEVRAALTRSTDDGPVRGLVMVFRDMTRLNQVELERQGLAAIVGSSSDAIIGKDLQGRITSWNAAAQALFGYSADEAIGQPVQMLLPADRQGEEAHILAELASGHRVPAFDTVRLAKDGTPVPVSLTISPILDATGQVVGASKIARDISHQRRAEAALRESQARLRFALESAQIGDWELDLVTGLARRSARHDRCFGYAEYQPHWPPRSMLRHVHPDDRDRVDRAFKTAIRQRSDLQFDCRVIWPDDSLHWISMQASVLEEPGQSPRMLGIVTDISQHKQAEQARLKALELQAENHRIQEASRLKSQFLANMSHELRTPLNAIIGFADVLQSGMVPADSPKHATFLGHIANSGRHLLQLINDVLDLSKVESGKFDFLPEPVHLPRLVQEVLDVLQTDLQRRHLTVQVDIAAGLDDLRLDPARLKQVLYNYLSNAIKFSHDGGRIAVRARPQALHELRIEVEDNGIGIAEADLPRLFVEFQQLDTGYGKRHAGTGLGLALTRRLVQAQGGEVGVRSTPGVGSVFHLVLPRQAVAAGQTTGAAPAAAAASAAHAANSANAPDTAARPAAATQSSAGLDGPLPASLAAQAARHLLVIQRNAALRAALAQGVTQPGLQVDTAATGQAALHLAASQAYDAVTLDLALTDQPGLGVLADLRRQRPDRDLPVLGVSMGPGIDSGASGSASFAVADVLSKPLRGHEVLLALERFGLLARPGQTVMVVDDDPLALELMRSTLQPAGLNVVTVADGRQALAQLPLHRPQALILDLMMPGFDGFDVLHALQQMPEWRTLPVFIWTSMVLTNDEYALLARSAQAIVSKGGGQLQGLLDGLRQWHGTDQNRAKITP